ncbi:MAG: response regulator [Ferruginibacter sp.]
MAHILLIEDNHDIRENTTEILELAGYKVSSAANGKAGVELAISNPPDIIVCDIMMPVLDGYGVLHLLNRNPQLTGIPFIFLTAKAERADFRKGMEMGADDYVTKPFTDIELLTAIESRLKKSELLKKDYAGDADGMRQMIRDFKGHDLSNITNANECHEYLKKQLLYKEGSYPRYLFHIKKGKIKTFKINELGKEFTTNIFSEGDFFGYTAILEKSAYKENAEAMEDCEITLIAKDDFDQLIEKSPEASKKFIHLLASNVSEKEQQLLGLAYNSLRKRVADTLISLKKKFHTKTDEQFSMHISREDLANLAGTATESLIRTLSDFKSEKIIEIKEGNIVILDEEKLNRMLN